MIAKKPNIIPVSGQSNVEVVAGQLEKLILEGFYSPGERIPSEHELRTLFNVGRSSIREAVKMLKAKNLVHNVPGFGTYVSKPEERGFSPEHILDPKSEADLLNIMEIRLSLEPKNAFFAATRATDEELDALRRHHAEHVAGLAANIPLDIHVEMDIDFHLMIARATHNPVALDIMNLVRNFLVGQQTATAPDEERRKQAFRLHERVLHALCARDAQKSQEEMAKHIETTYEQIRSIIETSKRASARLRARSN